jgi:hypothetical protein
MIIKFNDETTLVLDEQWEPISFVFENGDTFLFTSNTTSIEKHIELIRHALTIKEPIKGMLKFAFGDEIKYEFEIPKYFIDNQVL